MLEYLGQFSDPEMVKRHIEAADRDEMSVRESELKDVEAGLAELDAQFTQILGFLRRGVLNEQEFVKANNMARDQVSALHERKSALRLWIDEQKDRAQTRDRVPGLIKMFVEDFETMDPRLRSPTFRPYSKLPASAGTLSSWSSGFRQPDQPWR